MEVVDRKALVEDVGVVGAEAGHLAILTEG